jgi:hypothetical protein
MATGQGNEENYMWEADNIFLLGTGKGKHRRQQS